MAALCQSLLRLRDASKAALIVVHHVRKSIGRDEMGRAFRGSSALHAVGDSYLLLARPSANLAAVELRFQFRYAAPAGADVTQALAGIGKEARHNQLREQVMQRADCSKSTAQLAISQACRQGGIVQDNGQYRLPW